MIIINLHRRHTDTQTQRDTPAAPTPEIVYTAPAHDWPAVADRVQTYIDHTGHDWTRAYNALGRPSGILAAQWLAFIVPRLRDTERR